MKTKAAITETGGEPRLAVTPLTPVQRGAIGVVSVWGGDARRMVERFFSPVVPGEVIYSRLKHRGEVIDEVLLWTVEKGNSLSGFSEVEISFHGGAVAREKMIGFWREQGASVVPFDAYLEMSGRYDRIQKEAFSALCRVRTGKQLVFVLKQLQGQLSEKIAALYAVPQRGGYAAQLQDLVKLGEKGVRVVNGLRVMIAGPPNSGKSTLVNRLSGRNRSIVTEVPGTTRDLLEAAGEIDGVPVVYVDTCGISPDGGILEQLGMKKVGEEIARSDIVLCLGMDPGALPGRPGRVLHLGPKADLGGSFPPSVMPVSGLTGKGVPELEEKIRDLFFENMTLEQPAPFTARQVDLLREAAFCVERDSMDESKKVLHRLL